MTLQLHDLTDDFNRASAPVGLVHMPRRMGYYANFGKRLFDMLAVLGSSFAVVPLVAILAFLVAMDGHNPFYWSERVGRSGRNFRMLKLRTMIPNADRLLEDFLSANESAQAEWNSTQKLKSDPRITYVGRLLRKTSFDELPQLWNVLIGDMSLVGPRPMMPSQRQLYTGLSYYALRPGITGPWQVSDRNECSFSKRAEYDRTYDKNVSFSNDLKLLLMTLRVVMKGTGY